MFGSQTVRRFYSKKPLDFCNLDLLSIQTASYKKFIDVELDQVLSQILNTTVVRGKNQKFGAGRPSKKIVLTDSSVEEPFMQIKYNNVRLIHPSFTESDAFFYKKTYAAKVFINISFYDYKHKSRMLNYESFLMDLPLMLEDGSFIINGIKKVVVPQLIRSNGIAFQLKEDIGKHLKTYKFTVQPEMGLWLNFDFKIEAKVKTNEISRKLALRIDLNRKISFICFLKIFGITNQNLLSIFNQEKWLVREILAETSVNSVNKNVLDIVAKIIQHLSEIDTNINKISLRYLQQIKLIFVSYSNYYFYVQPKPSRTFDFICANKVKIQKMLSDEIKINCQISFFANDNLKYLIRKTAQSAKNNFSKSRLKKLTFSLLCKSTKFMPTQIINYVTKKSVTHLITQRKTCIKSIQKDRSKINDEMIQILDNLITYSDVTIMENFHGLLKYEGISNDINSLIYNVVKGNFIPPGNFKKAIENFRLFSHEQSLMLTMRSMHLVEPLSNKSISQYFENLFLNPDKYCLDTNSEKATKEKLNVFYRLAYKTLAKPIYNRKKEIVIPKDTYLNHDWMRKLENCQKQGFLEKDYVLFGNKKIKVEEVSIYRSDNRRKIIKLIGHPIREKKIERQLKISYLLSAINYLVYLDEGVGELDKIDSLNKRRIKTANEIFRNIVRSAFASFKSTVRDIYLRECSYAEKPNLQSVVLKILTTKNISAAIHEFINTSQLCQFLDQTNPLSDLSNKRRITTLGPGGLTSDRAGINVRDVHATYFGRICPIESPEGANIGLICNLSCYSKINEGGFLQAAYHPVKDSVVNYEKIVYLVSSEEYDMNIAEPNLQVDDNGLILTKQVFCRNSGVPCVVSSEKVDYCMINGFQIISIASALIPFLENNDSNRTLMGANMQRQAVPLLFPEAPIVGTGLEWAVVKSIRWAQHAKIDGEVIFADATRIVIANSDEDGTKNSSKVNHQLITFQKTNQNTTILQRSIVKIGQKVKKDDIIADGSAMVKGELALGRNLTVAFLNFHGYNFEDAIIVSERLARDEVLTSLHIEEFVVNVMHTKLGNEELVRDIPGVPDELTRNLDECGIVAVGSYVHSGDILVGKVSPQPNIKEIAEFKLLSKIFGEKARKIINTSFVVPNGSSGIVMDYKVVTNKSTREVLGDNIIMMIKIRLCRRYSIQEGDKLAGRHGNKGVISIVLPECDMPYLADGTPIDIILNPLGVPSRMNIGQIYEMQLANALVKLNSKIICPPFNCPTYEQISEISVSAGLDADGKSILYDGLTGEKFPQRIAVGSIYIMKLNHMVENKIHARCTGNYSLITQQPLGGRSQTGGQRLGEMEVWALEAYGAANILQEMLTIKSDDIIGRSRTYENIIMNREPAKPNPPASINVLIAEMQALGFYLEFNVSEQDQHLFEAVDQKVLKKANHENLNTDNLERKDSNNDKQNRSNKKDTNG